MKMESLHLVCGYFFPSLLLHMVTGGKIIGVYEDDELNGSIKMDIEHYFTETGNGEGNG